MTTRTRQRMSSVLGTLCLIGFSAPSQAAWPHDKPIEIIVGFTPGGGQDIMVRTLQPYLEKELDAKIVVNNKPGGGGELAYTALSQAAPDGYTLSTISVPSFVTTQIARNVKYEPDNIVPVARLVELPSTIVVNAKSSIRSLKDLVDLSKTKPKAVSYGGSGVGTDDHLSALLFNNIGVGLNYIPYPGGSEAWTALLGNHLVAASASPNVSESDPNMRAIAVLAEQRSSILPDVPTAKEQGYNVFMGSGRGLAAHIKVPQEIRLKISQAVRSALLNPDFQRKAKQINLYIDYKDGADWHHDIKAKKIEYQALWDKSPWVKK